MKSELEAINRATRGGWFGMLQDKMTFQKAFKDPIFWKALGQTEGWDDENDPAVALNQAVDGSQWEATQARYEKYLAEGKESEEFFNKLLK